MTTTENPPVADREALRRRYRAERDKRAAILLAGEEWWECSCTTDLQSCPACRQAAAHEYESRQRMYGFSIM